MSNIRIPTTDLDFDQIKTNLKTFLSGQTEFQDYDFEGSAMNVLMDILAYNTHYNALYKNLAVNEMFLDSASKRSSVVSRAKELGYIPSSATSATAYVNLTVSNTATKPPTLILPAESPFSSTFDGQSYTFYTTEDTITALNLDGATYSFSNIPIKEGTPLQFRYTASAGQRYIIPNMDADLSTLTVRVQDSASSANFVTFNNQEYLINLTEKDPIYFVKEIDNQLYELEFGNGVIGKALQPGNVVTLRYLVSNKSSPNGAKIFGYQGSSLLGGSVQVITQIEAAGGSDIEDIESIRYNAPRAYSTQNRAVTTDDYKSLVTNNYSNAESVSVWGGQDNLPPVYGKAFICVKPKNALVLTPTEKDFIKREILRSKNVVSITPELVDATYIDLQIDVTAYYNPRLTTYSPEQIKALVYQTIIDYNDKTLNRFDGVFRFSKLSALVDNTEPSIVSNIMTIKLYRQVEIKYNLLANYYVNLANPIYNSGVPVESIMSSGFYIDGESSTMYFDDLPSISSVGGVITGFGLLRMFYYFNNNKVYIDESVGTVDYSNGIIQINGLNIIGIEGAVFEFIIKPQSNDVVAVRNQLVKIPPELLNVNVILDRVASGDAAGNTNYIFTSSRN
jgi:hypothetical protein